MTLLSALRATKVLGLAVVLVAGGMTAAEAGDGWHPRRHHGHHGRYHQLPRMDRNAVHDGHRLGTELRYGRAGRPLLRREGDFYGGAVTAYRERGNGIYFYVDGDDGPIGWYDRPVRRHRSGPKVITVRPGQSGCAWQAGVCVIRPGY